MTTNQQMFLYAVEEMNFTRAAERAFVTQQCLSDHIRRLEKNYNVKLFDRTPKLKLTKAGEILYASLMEIQKIENHVEQTISESSKDVSGNIIFANYLNIMFLPNIGELAIFITSFVGATLGFLWYNSHPAEVFMGDTGSLAIGGIIAVFALLIRKELLIPVLCGIFLMESLSVIIQTAGCKMYRRKAHLPLGQPVPIEKRPFLMTPLHHHYQKKGIKEQKIVTRFYIIGILLAIISIVTLKLR